MKTVIYVLRNFHSTWPALRQRPVHTSPFSSVQVRFTLPAVSASHKVLRQPTLLLLPE